MDLSASPLTPGRQDPPLFSLFRPASSAAPPRLALPGLSRLTRCRGEYRRSSAALALLRRALSAAVPLFEESTFSCRTTSLILVFIITVTCSNSVQFVTFPSCHTSTINATPTCILSVSTNNCFVNYSMEMSKVCAIFGGSRGIGQAVAQLLAQKGYCLAVIARNLDRAQTTANSLGGHLAFSCDVSKEEDIQNVFREMEKSLGHISFLVNAAGINRDGLLLRTKADDMISQLQTNLLGTMLTCKAAVKSMIQQQGGAIVNIGSIVGLKGHSGQSVYSASKAGLVGFSRSLAKEIARKNIRVNVVAPGFIHTDMTAHLKEEQLKKTIPLGRFGEPQEVAKAVVFLLQSSYVTGQVLVIDGGLQLLF
ncbi:3-oxoacyl-[acyl-carrier-protein] reductase isoform X2 [Rhineura floridana]|uniref:3-oxoacyl-[acyl-carrier-protein] reductase isoform X2 n=1 Tax=Rhineura floridana TaxID=261503 RepID=UPI002AC86E98|nr:3-oxoacyl-[acyl-carrier-protein] reductase isoform X2 [Rhineura floridana]